MAPCLSRLCPLCLLFVLCVGVCVRILPAAFNSTGTVPNSFLELGGKNGHYGRIPVHIRKGEAGDVCLQWGGQLRVDIHPVLDTGIHVSLHLLTQAILVLL